jgi:hypothetical protein
MDILVLRRVGPDSYRDVGQNQIPKSRDKLCHLRVGFFTLTGNVLQLQEVGDFEAQNCLPALNLIRFKKLHLSTEPAFLPNACYKLPYFP